MLFSTMLCVMPMKNENQIGAVELFERIAEEPFGMGHRQLEPDDRHPAECRAEESLRYDLM